VLLDVGNKDILDSGVGSIGSVAMGVWCKLVFLGGRGGVVPAALVGFAVVLAVASSSSALASYGGIRFGCSVVDTVVRTISTSVVAVVPIDFVFRFRIPAIRPSVVVRRFGFSMSIGFKTSPVIGSRKLS
jgi:hypothetical protein